MAEIHSHGIVRRTKRAEGPNKINIRKVSFFSLSETNAVTENVRPDVFHYKNDATRLTTHIPQRTGRPRYAVRHCA